jgi:hypothetical protein
MKATKATKATGKIQESYQKNLDCVFLGLDKDFCKVIDCRIYRSNSFQTCYCCLWIIGEGKSIEGSAKAGSSGYDKQSLAIQLALLDAGIELSHYIDGDTGTEKALLAAARAIGIKKKLHIIKAYASGDIAEVHRIRAKNQRKKGIDHEELSNN